MTPERAHPMQNQCRTAPILVHECPPFGPHLLAIGWQNTGLPQTSESSFARPWQSSERHGGRKGVTTKSAKGTKIEFNDLSHRVIFEFMDFTAFEGIHLLPSFALFANFVVN